MESATADETTPSDAITPQSQRRSASRKSITMTAEPAIPTRTIAVPDLEPVWFLELELTLACQLRCGHCYNKSSPAGSHGSMTRYDWEQVIGAAPAAGIRRVQLIGGEPTMHPDFLPLAEYVLRAGLELQVFSNLYHVTPALWELYAKPRVTLATSYYSDVAELHDGVTRQPRSHKRTRAAIVRALECGIPLKVAIVDTFEGQRAYEAHAEMVALGVPTSPRSIGCAVSDEPPRGRASRRPAPNCAASAATAAPPSIRTGTSPCASCRGSCPRPGTCATPRSARSSTARPGRLCCRWCPGSATNRPAHRYRSARRRTTATTARPPPQSARAMRCSCPSPPATSVRQETSERPEPGE